MTLTILIILFSFLKKIEYEITNYYWLVNRFTLESEPKKNSKNNQYKSNGSATFRIAKWERFTKKQNGYRTVETAMDKGKNMAREELDTVAIEPLSPVSQLLSSPETFIVITFGSKTRLNLSSFVEGLNNTLINAPRFCCKMVNIYVYA